MLKKRSSYQGGFTLIEMVIVIVVIGILMGIAFQGISSVQQNARDTRRLADLRKVQTHLELYFGKCGHYPSTQNCGDLSGGTGSLAWATLTTKLAEVVNESEVPKDPIPAQSYQYRFGNGGLEYALARTRKIGTNRDVTGTIIGDLNCGTFYCIRS
jgi:general secretion pathway protein G